MIEQNGGRRKASARYIRRGTRGIACRRRERKSPPALYVSGRSPFFFLRHRDRRPMMSEHSDRGRAGHDGVNGIERGKHIAQGGAGRPDLTKAVPYPSRGREGGGEAAGLPPRTDRYDAGADAYDTRIKTRLQTMRPAATTVTKKMLRRLAGNLPRLSQCWASK